jgi:inner membrane transporter RhtA
VLSSALPYTLEMIALRHLPRQVFGILVSASPAVSALAGFAVLGETLASTQWLAITLVIVAAGGSAWGGGSDPEPT